MADNKKKLPEEEMEPEEGIYTLVDEEGVETQFQVIGAVEMDGTQYFAMIPVEPKEGEEDQYTILKLEKDENGEDMLSSIDDDDEFDKVADYFDDQFEFEEDYDK